jgi:hypothetical protein
MAALVDGAKFHELVFGGALVDLGSKLDAEFDLALWYRAWTLGSTRRRITRPWRRIGSMGSGRTEGAKCKRSSTFEPLALAVKL